MRSEVQLRALKDVRASLAGEIEGANKDVRDRLYFAQRGDYAMGSPVLLERAKARHTAAVAALEAFDREHGSLVEETK